MRTKKLLPSLLIPLMLCTAVFLHAQDGEAEEDNDEDIYTESDWSRMANLYSAGDTLLTINLGLVKPLFFVDRDEGYLKTQINLAGFGSVGVNYFLDPHWFIGGEVGGMFASTIGENMYYSIPMGARGGYQFILGRFEIPLYVMVGFAPQFHAELSYFGLFVKPATGVFFRWKSDWSFGINTSFWWVPEWTGKTRESTSNISIHGFFWEFSVGVRYHF